MSSNVPEPDENINRTFASVGHAITKWELLEWQLSHSYSIFVGKPRRLDAIEEYGRENSIFNNRMIRLEKTSQQYFQSCPSQEIEGAFCSIIAECKTISIKRHHIAHGVVMAIPVCDKPDVDGWVIPNVGYMVVPPRYAAQSLTKKTGVYYMYGSAQIDQIAQEFQAATNRVAAFNDFLSPQQ